MKSSLTLLIAILTGIIGYFVYVNIHVLDFTHHTVNQIITYVQPTLLFVMLYVSFCKVSPKELKPRRWMMKLLGIQVFSFVLLGILIICIPNIPGKAVVESAMICMICPTATAASVLTTKLNGNPSTVVSYTCLINFSAALAIPVIVSFIHEGVYEYDFATSFALILGKVFPLLILPLLLAWFTMFMFPKVHRKILNQKDLAFNLWAIALTLAIAITVKAIMHSDNTLLEMVCIAIASLLCCLVQFYLGHKIGKNHGEPVAGTQSLGQKNTIFAIWMGYTFLNPVTAMAGGFYSVWHNVFNSWQLWQTAKNKKN